LHCMVECHMARHAKLKSNSQIWCEHELTAPSYNCTSMQSGHLVFLGTARHCKELWQVVHTQIHSEALFQQMH